MTKSAILLGSSLGEARSELSSRLKRSSRRLPRRSTRPSVNITRQPRSKRNSCPCSRSVARPAAAPAAREAPRPAPTRPAPARVARRGERDGPGPDSRTPNERGARRPSTPARETRFEPLQGLARRTLFERSRPRVWRSRLMISPPEVVALHVADDEGDEVLVDGNDVVPVAADLDADGRRPVAGATSHPLMGGMASGRRCRCSSCEIVVRGR